MHVSKNPFKALYDQYQVLLILWPFLWKQLLLASVTAVHCRPFQNSSLSSLSPCLSLSRVSLAAPCSTSTPSAAEGPSRLPSAETPLRCEPRNLTLSSTHPPLASPSSAHLLPVASSSPLILWSPSEAAFYLNWLSLSFPSLCYLTSFSHHKDSVGLEMYTVFTGLEN